MRELTHEEFELVAGGDFNQTNDVHELGQGNYQNGGDSHNSNTVTLQSGGGNSGNFPFNIGNFAAQNR